MNTTTPTNPISTTEDHTIPNTDDDPATIPSTTTSFENLISQLKQNKTNIPHWMRHTIKVTYKDNKNVVHRGVLSKNTPHTWILTIRYSKRLTKTYTFSNDDVINLHNKKRLLHGHNHLLTSNPETKQSVSKDSNLQTKSSLTHDLPVSSMPKDRSFRIDQLQ